MAYGTLPLAVTGAIVPAAWGNQARDNDEYFKGNAGAVAISNATTFAGGISAPTVNAGPNASAMLSWQDRADNTIWAWYANAGTARLFSNAAGDVLSVAYATGGMTWTSVNDRLTGIPPTRLRLETRMGMLGAGGGTAQTNYNADGTLEYIYFPDGINGASTLTFEYSAGKVTAIRLRNGGGAGTILNSVVFTYDGSNRVATIAQS